MRGAELDDSLQVIFCIVELDCALQLVTHGAVSQIVNAVLVVIEDYSVTIVESDLPEPFWHDMN